MVKLFVIIFAICLTYCLGLPVHEGHEEKRDDERIVLRLDDAHGAGSSGLRPGGGIGEVGPDAHQGGHGGPSAGWGHRGHHGHGHGHGHWHGHGHGHGHGYGYGRR